MSKKSSSNTCPICDSTSTVNTIKRYHYTQSGLDNVYLENTVVQINCPVHGNLVHIPGEQQLLQVLALVLLEKPGILLPNELLYLRKASGMTQSVLAKLLGLRGHATVAERESGKSKITVESDFYFRAKIARTLWDMAMNSPKESFFAPIHVERLRMQLEKFTDLVIRPLSKRTTDLNLVLDHEAWRSRAA